MLEKGTESLPMSQLAAFARTNSGTSLPHHAEEVSCRNSEAESSCTSDFSHNDDDPPQNGPE